MASVTGLKKLFANLFHRASTPPTLDPGELDAEWLVVGLGNPEPDYSGTRHNVGYMVVDDLLAPRGDLLQPVKGHRVHAAQLADHAVAVRADTYMNTTGEAIGPLARALHIAPDHVIAVHDELDLPPHKVKLKAGGNENGHNGLKSLTEHLGTRDFLRVRVGIGRPPRGIAVPDWVLGDIDNGPGLDRATELAAEGVRGTVKHGLQKAQNAIHSR